MSQPHTLKAKERVTLSMYVFISLLLSHRKHFYNENFNCEHVNELVMNENALFFLENGYSKAS